MAEGANNGTGSKSVFADKDERTVSNHAYYLTMQERFRQMRQYPKILTRF